MEKFVECFYETLMKECDSFGYLPLLKEHDLAVTVKKDRESYKVMLEDTNDCSCVVLLCILIPENRNDSWRLRYQCFDMISAIYWYLQR